LQGVRVTLKALKPNGFRGPLVTVGDHLKAKRLSLGMVQKDVAKHLEVDHWTLLNWEKNRTTALRHCDRSVERRFCVREVA
jgi:DNA-binding XRE family transcriptional regulator